MYNSLHYTYYLYIVMYYRNNLVSLGEEYDKSGKLHSSSRFEERMKLFGSLDMC